MLLARARESATEYADAPEAEERVGGGGGAAAAAVADFTGEEGVALLLPLLLLAALFVDTSVVDVECDACGGTSLKCNNSASRSSLNDGAAGIEAGLMMCWCGRLPLRCCCAEEEGVLVTDPGALPVLLFATLRFGGGGGVLVRTDAGVELLVLLGLLLLLLLGVAVAAERPAGGGGGGGGGGAAVLVCGCPTGVVVVPGALAGVVVADTDDATVLPLLFALRDLAGGSG